MGPRARGRWRRVCPRSGRDARRTRAKHGTRGRCYDAWSGRLDMSGKLESRGRSGVDGLEEDLALTEEGHFRGRSLPYVRAASLLRGIVGGPYRVDGVVASLNRVWASRSFHAYFDRPFLLLASLRAEALASTQHPLARGFASGSPDALAVTREALVEALSEGHTGVWSLLSSRTPQTNEVSRAVVWRWPAELAGCGGRARPIGLVDVGAAGGLNLIADRWPGSWEDVKGAPLAVSSNLDVRMRAGFDLQPLDFKVDGDIAWGRACLWPGATQRLARFERAVRAWQAPTPTGDAAPTLSALNASLVPSRLPRILAELPRDALLIVYQTIVRDYMDTQRRDRYEDGMRRWLASLPARRAVWIEGETTSHPAALDITAHVPDGAGGVSSMSLANTHVHPAVVDVHAQEVRRFAAYFKGGDR
jgi:hypothetical protein